MKKKSVRIFAGQFGKNNFSNNFQPTSPPPLSTREGLLAKLEAQNVCWGEAKSAKFRTFPQKIFFLFCILPLSTWGQEIKSFSKMQTDNSTAPVRVINAEFNKNNDIYLKDFDIYRAYIQGDLDNAEQVANEIKAGKQLHPYAKHINRIFDSKIKNLPIGYKGFYVLEESYYKYPDKDTLIKPYIFWFEPSPKGEVILHSMQIPPQIDKKQLKNSNETLVIDYNDLKESPTFKPAIYTRTEKGFYIKAPNDLPNGMRFTLEETIGPDSFEVMELLEKDGKIMTPYSTPLIYKRIKN